MSHGVPAARRLHPENGASLSASHSDEERHIARAEPSAHGRQTPGLPAPVRDDDAHLIAAFKDDHLAPLLREQYTLLAQLEDDVANSTVDIAWFGSQLNAVKQKQAELAALVSSS